MKKLNEINYKIAYYFAVKPFASRKGKEILNFGKSM